MGIVRCKSRLALLAVLLSAMIVAGAPPALGDVGEKIIQRCTHGQSLSGFSQRAYSRALKELSADAEEYTDCSSLIRQAQQAGAGRQSSPGGGPVGSAAPAAATQVSPAEQQAVTRAASAPPAPVSLDGQVIRPGVVHASIASALSALPTPLIAVLALLLACLLGVVVRMVHNRVRVGRPD